VFFSNTGTATWTKGSDTQVDLAACLSDKVTCNAQDPSDATFNSGWLSTTRYATTTQATVAPGSLATFAYNIKAPANATGTHRFNGDLVLASSGAGFIPRATTRTRTVNPVGTSLFRRRHRRQGARRSRQHVQLRRHRRADTDAAQLRSGALGLRMRRDDLRQPGHRERHANRGRSLPARPIRRTGCARNGNGVISQTARCRSPKRARSMTTCPPAPQSPASRT